MSRRLPLSGIDATLFHLDQATNPAEVVVLLFFDEPLDRSRIRHTLETKLLPIQRLRSRIVQRGLRAVWEEDPAFSLTRHVLWHHLAGHGLTALRSLTDEVLRESLDPRDPPWRFHFVEMEGQGALIARFHHCIGDGFALIGLLQTLADRATPSVRSPNATGTWVPGLRQFMQSVFGVVVLGSDSPTVLKHPLRGGSHVAWSKGASLKRVRAEAHRRGVKINDFLIAILTGALRQHLRASGARVNSVDLRAIVPVNLRSPGDNALGNRFGLVFLPLPVHERSAARRLQTVAETMRSLKQRPDAMVVYALLQSLALLPTPVVRTMTRFFGRKASLVITNVPGPEERLSLAGHRIAHILFWVPHPAGLGLGVSILSYAGEVRIGVRADAAVMRNPADLIRRFERDLDHALSRPGRVRTSARNKALEWKA